VARLATSAGLLRTDPLDRADQSDRCEWADGSKRVPEARCCICQSHGEWYSQFHLVLKQCLIRSASILKSLLDGGGCCAALNEAALA